MQEKMQMRLSRCDVKCSRTNWFPEMKLGTQARCAHAICVAQVISGNMPEERLAFRSTVIAAQIAKNVAERLLFHFPWAVPQTVSKTIPAKLT
ncbi:hypothetical protein AVEN_20419-1 [Araneus ventricosus]|uniref:Uncharacterized protein n=1 Tax=Araneus ventricosus TaxID=182803 RepID=A0A4Y2MRE7_ARAVE|nr:hypothetical protein AVEN_20419-1 [Araneus ventricosus]